MKQITTIFFFFSSVAFSDISMVEVFDFLNTYVINCNASNVDKIVETVPEGGVLIISEGGKHKLNLSRQELKDNLEKFYSKIYAKSYIYSAEVKSIKAINENIFMINMLVSETYILKKDGEVHKSKYLESITIENINGEIFINESYKFPATNSIISQ